MSTYAIPILEDTLDLIQVLNDGVRPEIEDEPTYFVFETDGPTDTQNHDIRFHENLYEGKIGHVGEGYVIRILK